MMLQGYCRTKTSPGGLAELDGLGRPFSEYIQRVPALHAFWDLEKNVLGGVHKLRLQDEVGRWLSKCQQMLTKVGRWSVLCKR